MLIQLGGHNNIYTAALDTTAKTLTISGVLGFDLTDQSLNNIWDTTASKAIPCNRVTCALTRVSGQPVWVFTFLTLPSGLANGDTLVITLDVPEDKAAYAVQGYMASKV